MNKDLTNAISECENKIGDAINELKRKAKPAQISKVTVRIRKLEFKKGEYKYLPESINVVLTNSQGTKNLQ